MTVVNLTPHAVTVLGEVGPAVTFPAAGPVARVRELVGEARSLQSQAGTVSVRAVAYAPEVDDLPPPADGTFYLVSRITAAAAGRGDLVFPQGELRDAAGRITGCRALGFFAPEAGSDA